MSISLPQHDLSATRAPDLADRRARYAWNTTYLPPLPMLDIPGVDHTGLNDIYDVLAGSYLGLPVEERPSTAWALQKVKCSAPILYDVLEQIPRAEWAAAFIAIGGVLEQRAAPDVARVLAGIAEQMVARQGGRDFLPRASDVTKPLYGALTHLITAITEAPQQRAGLLGEVVHAIEGLFGGEARPRTERGQAAIAGLADEASALPPELRTVGAIVSGVLSFGMNVDAEPTPLHELSDYADLVIELAPPTGFQGVSDDVAFGRARLAGANPVVLHRVRTSADLPAAFPVTDRHLQASLVALGLDEDFARQCTLDGAAKAGQLYLVDYAMLADLPTRRGPERDLFGRVLHGTGRQRFLPAPFGLFFQAPADQGGALLPVAIQAGRDPAVFEIFTPEHPTGLWQNAKACFECADFHHHELFTHLYGVHFALEPLVMCARRQLSVRHPVSVLLAPAYKDVLWNNFLGRQWLANPKGFLDQLMAVDLDSSVALLKRAQAASSIWDVNLPRRMAAQGLDDVAALPDYPFRDDGMLLWGALSAFVSEYLGLYYKSDADVVADTEVAAWIAELGAPTGGAVRGLPDVIDTLEALCELVTTLLFHSGPFHSAVNYTQYEQMADVPEKPCSIYADPAKLRDVTLMDLLPHSETARTQMRVLYLLASLRGDTWSQVGLSWYPDPAAWPAVARFAVELDRVERVIARKNATARKAWPYVHLLPSQVAVAASV